MKNLEVPAAPPEAPRHETSNESEGEAGILNAVILGLAEISQRAETLRRQSAQRFAQEIQTAVTGSSTDAERIANDAKLKLDALNRKNEKNRRDAETNILSRFRRVIASHPMMSTLLLSGALHVSPAMKDAAALVRAEVEHATGADWHEGMVVHLQSESEKQEVLRAKTEREKRIHPEAIDQYKTELQERINRGDIPTLKEEYFHLEELNGVAASEVASAKKHEGERAEYFSTLANGHIDRGFIRTLVNHPSGLIEQGDNGQGSVSKYFNTGVHNCVALAKGQLMILEDVISTFPESERQKYTLGMVRVDSHEFATLTINENGSTTTYDLEDVGEKHIRTRVGTEELPGTKAIPLSELKKGIASKRPVVLQAKAGTFNAGPRIDAVTNQPVNDGFEIAGKLAPAEAIRHEAEQKHIRPEPEKTTEPLKDSIIELSEYKETTVAEAKRVMDGVFDDNEIEIGDLPPFSAEAAQVFRVSDERKREGFPTIIAVGTLTNWSEDAIKALFNGGFDEIKIVANLDGKFDPRLANALAATEHDISVMLETDPNKVDGAPFDLDSLERLFKSANPARIKFKFRETLSHEELERLTQSGFHGTVEVVAPAGRERSGIIEDTFNMLESSPFAQVQILDYFQFLEEHPRYAFHEKLTLGDRYEFNKLDVKGSIHKLQSMTPASTAEQQIKAQRIHALTQYLQEFDENEKERARSIREVRAGFATSEDAERVLANVRRAGSHDRPEYFYSVDGLPPFSEETARALKCPTPPGVGQVDIMKAGTLEGWDARAIARLFYDGYPNVVIRTTPDGTFGSNIAEAFLLHSRLPQTTERTASFELDSGNPNASFDPDSIERIFRNANPEKAQFSFSKAPDKETLKRIARSGFAGTVTMPMDTDPEYARLLADAPLKEVYIRNPAAFLSTFPQYALKDKFTFLPDGLTQGEVEACLRILERATPTSPPEIKTKADRISNFKYELERLVEEQRMTASAHINSRTSRP